MCPILQRNSSKIDSSPGYPGVVFTEVIDSLLWLRRQILRGRPDRGSRFQIKYTAIDMQVMHICLIKADVKRRSDTRS